MRSRLLTIAVVLGTATCCPTLFLTVERMKPAPRPWLPDPVIESEHPIPQPSEIENRFLADTGKFATERYLDYTDAADPTDETGRRALVALTRIKDDHGFRHQIAQGGIAVAGKLSCRNEHGGCDAIQLATLSEEPVFPIVAISQKSQTHWRIARCARPAPANPVADAAARTCGVVSTGGLLTLQGAIPGRSGDDVTVELYTAKSGRPRLSSSLFTFIHITDAQVRDPTVFLGGRALSHKLDWLVQSFEYNIDLEFNDVALGEALIATIDQEVRVHGPDSPDRPAFLIHTGDAIDAGVTTELAIFHRLMDRLSIPWYDALGSHDVEAFGNLMPTRDRHGDEECATVESVAEGEIAVTRTHPRLSRWLLPNKLCIYAEIRCESCGAEKLRFVAAGRDGEPINHLNARKSFLGALEHQDADELPQPLPLPTKATSSARDLVNGFISTSVSRLSGGRLMWVGNQASATASDSPQRAPRCEQLTPYRPTRQHGFDLNPDPEHRGYYAFSSEIWVYPEETQARKLVSIVLDTEDFADNVKEVAAGVRGRMGKAQMQWLRDMLSCTQPRDLVLVFGHVPISEIDPADPGQPAGELEQILNEHGNVIAYFYGHHHVHQICGDKRNTTCSKFWEVETGSLLEFPQEARRVKLKYVGDGLAFLELVSFRERLANTSDERAKAVNLARRAAERDLCYSTPGATCSEDKRVRRTDGRDTNVRLWFPLPGD